MGVAELLRSLGTPVVLPFSVYFLFFLENRHNSDAFMIRILLIWIRKKIWHEFLSMLRQYFANQLFRGVHCQEQIVKFYGQINSNFDKKLREDVFIYKKSNKRKNTGLTDFVLRELRKL